MAYKDDQLIDAGTLKEVLGNFTPGDGGSADSAWPPKFVVFDDDAESATGYYEIFGEEAANVDQEFVKATAEEASRGEFWLGINSSWFDPAFGIDSSSEAALTASMPVGTLLFMLGDSNLDYTEKYRQVLWMVTGPAETRGTKVGVPVQALMVSGQALPKRAVINNSRMMYDKALEARFSEEQGFSLGEIVTFSKGIISNMGVTLSRYDVVPGTPVMVYESTEATVPSWMGVVTETTGAKAYKFMLISKSAAAADLSSYTAKISAAGYNIDLLTNDPTEQPLNLRGRNGVRIVADMPSSTLWFESNSKQAERFPMMPSIRSMIKSPVPGQDTTFNVLVSVALPAEYDTSRTIRARANNASGAIIADNVVIFQSSTIATMLSTAEAGKWKICNGSFNIDSHGEPFGGFVCFEIYDGVTAAYINVPTKTDSQSSLGKPAVLNPLSWTDPDESHPSGRLLFNFDQETMSITDNGELAANYISNSFPRLRLENGHLYADYPAGAAIYDGPSNPTVVAAPSSGGHVTGF